MESKKKTKPRAILVFGAPCSGKTTFCEKFSQRFKAPYYNLQSLREEADFTEKQIHVVLEAISKTGQNIIIEGGLDTENENFSRSVAIIPPSFGSKLTLIPLRLALSLSFVPLLVPKRNTTLVFAPWKLPPKPKSPSFSLVSIHLIHNFLTSSPNFPRIKIRPFSFYGAIYA